MDDFSIPPVIWLNYIEYVALADPWMVYGWFIGQYWPLIWANYNHSLI
jgi:hypothetical protein